MRRVERRSSQKNRGRNADTPAAIPASGWKDVLWRLYRSLSDDRILLTAAGVTFYILLALVPTLNAFVSLYGLFNDRGSVLNHIELLGGIVPPGALDILRGQLTRITAENTSMLGSTALLSLAIALWSSSAGVKAMFKAMNVAYHEKEQRSLIVLSATALLFTVGGAMAGLLVISVVVLMPWLVSFLPVGNEIAWAVRVAAYVAMALVMSLALAALYRWGPSREDAKWRWITPGGVFALVAIASGSILFSWYVANFRNDDATYGSLGAVIGMMSWLWISITVIIVGAELNAEIEHQTARDSTTGPDRPLGKRGAHMADNVGEAWPLARVKGAGTSAVRKLVAIFPWLSVLLRLPANVRTWMSRNDRP